MRRGLEPALSPRGVQWRRGRRGHRSRFRFRSLARCGLFVSKQISGGVPGSFQIPKLAPYPSHGQASPSAM